MEDIVTGAYRKAFQLIKDNLDTLHLMANGLLERETLGSSDIDEIIAGREKLGSEGIDAETSK